MRRAWKRVPLVSLGILGISLLQTQARPQRTQPRTPAQAAKIFSGLGLDKNSTREKLQALATQPIDESSPALQAVAQFLELRPDQVQELVRLLQARQSALAPLMQNLPQLEEQLYALLNSGGAPTDIGQLVIQIHTLQEQAMLVQQSFLTNFQNLLGEEQRQRLEAVHVAAQLQPIVPAFQQLALL